MEQEKTKKCRICGLEKPLTDFGRNVRRPDNLQVECRECRRREYRRTHGGLAHALRNFRTGEMVAEAVRRGGTSAVLDELPAADVARYLAAGGYAVMPSEEMQRSDNGQDESKK